MGMSYRNFVSSKIVLGLSSKYDVTIMVEKSSMIENLIQESNIEFISFDYGFIQKVIKKISSIIEKLQYFSFYQKHRTKTMIKYIEREKKNKSFKFFYTMANILGSLFNKYSFISFHYQYILTKDIRLEIKNFDKVFLLSTDTLIDKAILKFCNKNSISTTVIVHSWDNLPARGFMSAKPDKLLLWNDIMKKQAISLHGILSEDINIVGIPQFSFYKSLEAQVSLENFKIFYGINNSKKIITYTCSASRVFPDENLFIDKLIKYLDSIDVILIIRLHPTERFEEYLKYYSNIQNVILDLPSGNFAATYTNKITSKNDDIIKFISLMKYSDIIINLASTITLDAVIFNTAVICPSFNIDSSLTNNWNNANEWYKSTHYQNIIESGAIVISKDMDMLKQDIVKYLDNKEYLEEERSLLAKDFCNININSIKEVVDNV